MWKWTIDGWEDEKERGSAVICQTLGLCPKRTSVIWKLGTSTCVRRVPSSWVSSEEDGLLNHRKTAWIIISVWKRKEREVCNNRKWTELSAPLESFQITHHFSQKTVAIANVLAETCSFPLCALPHGLGWAVSWVSYAWRSWIVWRVNRSFRSAEVLSWSLWCDLCHVQIRRIVYEPIRCQDDICLCFSSNRNQIHSIQMVRFIQIGFLLFFWTTTSRNEIESRNKKNRTNEAIFIIRGIEIIIPVKFT